MSEQETPRGTSSSTWIIIGIIALVVGGGCLVACLGVIGMGFALPMRQAQQQAIEAEAVRQEVQRAGERAQADSVNAQAEAEDKSQQEAVDAATQARPDGEALDEPQKTNPEEATPDGTDEPGR